MKPILMELTALGVAKFYMYGTIYDEVHTYFGEENLQLQ